MNLRTTNFDELPRRHYGAILADPPWRFETWNNLTAIPRDHRKKGYDKGYAGTNVSASCHYKTMSHRQIARLAVEDISAKDCALFLWCTWPTLREGLAVIAAWGFEYKTCGFDWMKAHARQIDMFADPEPLIGMGYWTRANTEPCLLATRGKPKRLNGDVRMGIIEPRREHSRKPDCVHGRIERLVAGPYLELFARQQRKNWDSWGNEIDHYSPLLTAAE